MLPVFTAAADRAARDGDGESPGCCRTFAQLDARHQSKSTADMQDLNSPSRTNPHAADKKWQAHRYAALLSVEMAEEGLTAGWALRCRSECP